MATLSSYGECQDVNQRCRSLVLPRKGIAMVQKGAKMTKMTRNATHGLLLAGSVLGVLALAFASGAQAFPGFHWGRHGSCGPHGDNACARACFTASESCREQVRVTAEVCSIKNCQSTTPADACVRQCFSDVGFDQKIAQCMQTTKSCIAACPAPTPE